MAATCPQLRARMGYGMPMWLAGARMREGYAAISAATRHFSIHFDSEAIVRELSRALPACGAGKRCINIRYGDDASYAAVKAAVAARFPGRAGGEVTVGSARGRRMGAGGRGALVRMPVRCAPGISEARGFCGRGTVLRARLVQVALMTLALSRVGASLCGCSDCQSVAACLSQLVQATLNALAAAMRRAKPVWSP